MDYVVIFCLINIVILLAVLLWVIIDIRYLLSRQVDIATRLECSTKNIVEQLEALSHLTTRLSKARKELIQGFKGPESLG